VVAAAVAATPTEGVCEWGRWTNGADDILIELYLDPSIRTGAVVCEAAEGWLAVYLDHSYEAFYEEETGAWGGEEIVEEKDGKPPLLLGRLAQLVRGRDLEWIVATEDGGRRVLRIELPKVADGAALASESIFDETLTIGGAACLVPGLSVAVEGAAGATAA